MQKLPIFPHLGHICHNVNTNRVSAISAPTGTGKSSCVPVALASLGARVIVTTPTIAAARTLSRFVQQQQPRFRIGFAGGGRIEYDASHQIVYCTLGHLYHALMRDRTVHFDVLMFDESHTVSTDAEMTEALIKYTWPQATYKLLISSATIDLESLQVRWASLGCPVAVTEVDVPHFPVTVEYRDETLHADEKGNLANALRAVKDVIVSANASEPPGHFLIFAPGAKEIDALIDMLNDVEALANCDVYPLHSQLNDDDIAVAVSQHPPVGWHRSIVVATDIAETSITIPHVVLVVDMGRQKNLRIAAHELTATELVTEWTSQFSAIQRRGRTGRTCPGKVIRMYTEEHGAHLPRRVDRELDRVPLFLVLIQLLHHGLDPELVLTPIIQRPSERVQESVHFLRTLGLIDEHFKLTPAARDVVQMPVNITLGVLLTRLPSEPLSVLLVAMLDVLANGTLFYLPRRKPRESADAFSDRVAEHKRTHYTRFRTNSDLITQLRVLVCHENEIKQLRGPIMQRVNGWCADNGINAKKVRAVYGTFKRLLAFTRITDFALPDLDARGVDAWVAKVTPVLVGLFGADSTFVTDCGERWIKVNGVPTMVYYLSRDAKPVLAKRILALSRFHTRKGARTFGFLSMVVPLSQ